MVPDEPVWSPLRVAAALRWYVWWMWMTRWSPKRVASGYHPSPWRVLRWHRRPFACDKKGLY